MFNKLFLTDSSGNGILMSLLLLNPPSTEDTLTENKHPLLMPLLVPQQFHFQLILHLYLLRTQVFLFQKPSLLN